jgi:glycosyltransferase involved in cell wall biosynthesis
MSQATEGSRPRISLVIPVYDEAECLPALLEEIEAALRSAPFTYEIVCIDDGSTDGSAELLDRRAQSNERLIVAHLDRNAGQTAAFVEGFRRARGEVIVTLDGDGQNPPAEIPRLVAALDEAGADVVAGFRHRRCDSWWRRVQARIANRVRNALSGETIRDTGCSLKAVRAEYLAAFPALDGMHRFIPTLCRMAGAHRVIEIPVDHRARSGGRSKYGMLDRAFRAFVDLLAVRWMQRRWVRYRVRPDARGDDGRLT